MHQLLRYLSLSFLAFALPQTALAKVPAQDETRLTLGVPAYVWHPKDRDFSQQWNDGWFNNEGVLIDLTWPMWDLGQNTNVRLGITGGVFDNSIFHTSVFGGGAAEIESFVTPNLALSLGTYAGVITGYEQNVAPAIAPYIGTSYSFTPRFEVGLRGFWLPAETLAGSDLAPSDAYVGVITIGTRF